MPAKLPQRAFKAAKFSKDAKKANISDAELCEAIRQVMAGQADELIAFRLLAKSYAGLTELQVEHLVSDQHFVEICHDDKAQV